MSFLNCLSLNYFVSKMCVFTKKCFTIGLHRVGYTVPRQWCFFGAYVSTACNISMQYELAITINRRGVPSTRVSTCSFLKKWRPALLSTVHRLAYIWWEAQSLRQVLGEQCLWGSAMSFSMKTGSQPSGVEYGGSWQKMLSVEGGKEEGSFGAVCACEAFV